MNSFINTALFIYQFGYVTQLTNKSCMLQWMSLVNSTDEKNILNMQHVIYYINHWFNKTEHEKFLNGSMTQSKQI